MKKRRWLGLGLAAMAVAALCVGCGRTPGGPPAYDAFVYEPKGGK